MIKNIVFDVGNVLIDFCWMKTCKNLGFSADVIESFRIHMIETDYWDAMDEGILSKEDAIAQFITNMPQYEKEIQMFWEQESTFVEEYDYSADLIRDLKQKGYGIYLLSNYPLEMYELHWPMFHFLPLVDGYVVSAVEKVRKPDAKIYEILLKRYGLNAEECIFFDDRMNNVDAAKKVGMQAALFEDKSSVYQVLV